MKMLANTPYIDKLVSVYRYGQEDYLTAQSSAFLQQLGKDLKFSTYTHVTFCTSVNIASDVAVLPGPECKKGNHWTAVVINALDGQILYSDLMGYPPPCELIEAV